MTPKENMNEAIGLINSANCILDILPKSDEYVNFTVDMNATAILSRLLFQTQGYDKVVNFLSKLLWKIPDWLEYPIKAFILAQLSMMYGCSVNPLITKKIINEGITFDLNSIDLANLFRHCPLSTSADKYGKYCYFDCDDKDYPEDLRYCKDLNAFMWYAVNRSQTDRCTWYGYQRQGDASAHTSFPADSEAHKQKATTGLVTFEYSPNGAGIKDAIGGQYFPQIPHHNLLHVFIGNTKPIDNAVSRTNQDITQDITDLQKDMDGFKKAKADLKKLKQKVNTAKSDLKKSNMPADELQGMKEVIAGDLEMIKKIQNCLNDNQIIQTECASMGFQATADNTGYQLFLNSINEYFTISTHAYTHTIGGGNATTSDGQKMKELNDQYQRNTNAQYRTEYENYYYNHFLAEFNAEYLWGLKLFDNKVIVAELLDALTGALSLNVKLTFEEGLLKNEVNRMVQDIIATDTTVVSDCFFSFDNDSYDRMVERTEAQMMGIGVLPDGTVIGNINPEDILNNLDNISPDATADENIDVIEQTLVQASTALGGPETVDGEYVSNLNADLEFQFIENLIKQLNFVVARNIVSPKLYLLLAINMKLMGEEPSVNIASFLMQMKNLLVGILREVSDQILKQLYEWLLEFVTLLAKQMAVRITREQFKYYTALLAKCVACFNALGRAGQGFDIANVGYADIYQDNTNEEPNVEC